MLNSVMMVPQRGKLPLWPWALSLDMNSLDPLGHYGVLPLSQPISFMIGFENLKIISWNVRGALNEHGQLFLKDLIRCKKPDIMFLLETRCQFSRASNFWNSMGFSPLFISEANGFSGGIWVLVNTATNLSSRLLYSHQQAVTFEVWRENLSWVCSAIYASPIPVKREELWSHLLHIRSNLVLPWMIVGDMNEILHPNEVRGG